MRPSSILTPTLFVLGLLGSTWTALGQTTFTESFDKEPTKGWFYSCQKEYLTEGTNGFLRVSGGGHALWLGDGATEAKAADFTVTVKHRYEQGKGTGEVAFRVSGTLEDHQFNWVMFQPHRDSRPTLPQG